MKRTAPKANEQLAFGFFPVSLLVTALRTTALLLSGILPILFFIAGYFLVQYLWKAGDSALKVATLGEKVIDRGVRGVDASVDKTESVVVLLVQNSLLSYLWDQVEAVVNEAPATPIAPVAPVIVQPPILLEMAWHPAIFWCGIVFASLLGVLCSIQLHRYIHGQLDAHPLPQPIPHSLAGGEPLRGRSRLRDPPPSSALASALTLASMGSEPIAYEEADMPRVGRDGGPDHTAVISQEELLPKSPAIFTFLGMPGSGKSYMIKSFLFYYKDYFKAGVVITGAKQNGDFRGLIDDEDIWDGWDVERFTQWWTDNKEYQNQQRALEEAKKPFRLLPPNFIVFDDLALGGVSAPKVFEDFIKTFRHTNTYVFYSTQAVTKGVSSAVQECTNYAFLFRGATAKSSLVTYNTFGNRMFQPHGGVALKSWKPAEFQAEWNKILTKSRHVLVMIQRRDSIPFYRTFVASPFEAGFRMRFFRR